MPPLEVTDLLQDAVLWEYADAQDRHGKQVVSAPRAIKVRWTVNDAQPAQPFDNTVTSSKLMVASIDIANMSLVWLGKLRDLPAGNKFPGIHQVVQSNTTPDIKNRNTRFEYNLMRFTDTLPTVQS